MSWEPGRPADQGDLETSEILASYGSHVFGPPNDWEAIWWRETDFADQHMGLELLARARIRDVPDEFNGRRLACTVYDWKRTLPSLEVGPDPLVNDERDLKGVAEAADRLTKALKKLVLQMKHPGSRLEDSHFTITWHEDRIGRLLGELNHLKTEAVTPLVTDSLRRNEIKRKSVKGWSALEGFYGRDLPGLYCETLGRSKFTISGDVDRPTEGIRFACVIASQVRGTTVMPGTFIKGYHRYRHAAGGGHRSNG